MIPSQEENHPSPTGDSAPPSTAKGCGDYSFTPAATALALIAQCVNSSCRVGEKIVVVAELHLKGQLGPMDGLVSKGLVSKARAALGQDLEKMIVSLDRGLRRWWASGMR